MPRPLKPYVVDSVWCESTRLRVDILFDRNRKNFFAKVGTNEVRAKDVEGCKVLARDLAAQSVAFSWTPIIVIDKTCKCSANLYSGEGPKRYAGVDVEFRRIEVSPDPSPRRGGKPGHVWRRHPLDVGDDELDLEDRRLFRDVCSHQDYGSTCEVPYTEEAWAALCAIADAVDAAAERLDALFADEHLEAKLLHVGSQHAVLALPAFNRRRNVEG